MALDGTYSEEYPVNAGVSQDSILGPTLFLLYNNDLPDIICSIAIYADDTTLYSECDQEAFDLLQQLELPSEFESDLRDINFNAEKTQKDFHLIGLITLVLLM